MFSFREFIKRGFLNAVGKMADYRIILNAAGWYDKGALLEEDLAEIQSAISVRRAAAPVDATSVDETPIDDAPSDAETPADDAPSDAETPIDDAPSDAETPAADVPSDAEAPIDDAPSDAETSADDAPSGDA